MDFLELAQSRYTTKKYDAQQKLSDDEIQKLKEVLRLSPSSINSQPWKFIFVSDEKMKKALADESYFNEHKVKESSYLIVFCAINNVPKFEEQIRKNLPEGALAYFTQKVKSLPEADIKAWFNNQVYLSLGFFLSACASMQIDSTPMEGINKEGYAKVLDLTDYSPLFAVAIGKRDSEDVNQPSHNPKLRLPLNEVVVSI